MPYVPGLNSRAYRCVPISLSTCSFATASTAAWISLVGMPGSKTRTFGPKSGDDEALAGPTPTSATSMARAQVSDVTRRVDMTRLPGSWPRVHRWLGAVPAAGSWAARVNSPAGGHGRRSAEIRQQANGRADLGRRSSIGRLGGGPGGEVAPSLIMAGPSKQSVELVDLHSSRRLMVPVTDSRSRAW